MIPEESTRQKIDALLTQCGWAVQDYTSLNLSAARGVALREVPLKNGRCDYLLLVDSKAVVIVEAKPEGATLSGVADQSAYYGDNLPKIFPTEEWLPFFYESTGAETFFRDERDLHPRSRRVFAFQRPETFAGWVQSELKHYRAPVLKSACEGRLVPTESEPARAEGRDYEPAKVLLQRILAKRRKKWNRCRKYKEPAAPDIANLPELLEGWVWTTIDQLAQVDTGATPKRGTSAFYNDGNIPWITSAALSKPFVDEASEFVTDEAFKTNLTLYESGALLVAMYGEGRTRGKCSELRIEATTNQAIVAVQCYISVRVYVKLSLLCQYENLRLTASGGVQPNLNLSLVKAITIPLPPLVEQNRIVTEVERRLSVV